MVYRHSEELLVANIEPVAWWLTIRKLGFLYRKLLALGLFVPFHFGKVQKGPGLEKGPGLWSCPRSRPKSGP